MKEKEERRLERTLNYTDVLIEEAIRQGDVSAYEAQTQKARETIIKLARITINPSWEPSLIKEEKNVRYQRMLQGKSIDLGRQERLTYLHYSRTEESRIYKEELTTTWMNHYEKKIGEQLRKNETPNLGRLKKELEEHIQEGELERFERTAKRIVWASKSLLTESVSVQERRTQALPPGRKPLETEALRRTIKNYTPGNKHYETLRNQVIQKRWERNPDDFLSAGPDNIN